MAGHSKWATTKRHKAAVDAKKGKAFSVYGKEITVAARNGGGDPGLNVRLRSIINSAKLVNMPAENIERAIKKGIGESGRTEILKLLYEGYGPSGVGFIVEIETDNKNRSASEVRSIFVKGGGSLASPGALTYNFQRQGQFLIDTKRISEEHLLKVALIAGADDIKTEGNYYKVLCTVNDFNKIAKIFEDHGIICESVKLFYIQNTKISVTDPAIAKQVLQLFQNLKDLEGVKTVYTNFDIDSFSLN